MKKILLTIGLGIAINIAIGQTITSSNIVNLGDTIIMATDISPSVSLGTGTAGNSWNFITLFQNSKDTTVFNTPSSVAGGTSFPSSTLTFIQEVNTPAISGFVNTFFKNGSSSLELNGISNATITAKHQNSETVITYPSVFGTTFMDTALIIATVSGAAVGQPLADSVKAKSITYITSDFNASGTLTTPFGVFPCIRQYLIREVIDTVWAKGALTGGGYILFSTNVDTSYSHQYYSDAANSKFPLVTYDLNKNGTLSGDIQWMVYYSPGVSTGIKEVLLKSISVYPNPATNKLTLDVEEKISQVIITDIAGKTIFTSENIIGNTIDVSSFVSGVYVISVKTDSYTATSKFIKE